MKVAGQWYRAVWWDDGRVAYIDQRKLPHRFEIASAGSVIEVASAIRDMGVRGAPTIGVTAAYGLALAARTGEQLENAYSVLLDSRPTAVNLKHGLSAVMAAAPDQSAMLEAARAFDDREVAAMEAIGSYGVEILIGAGRSGRSPQPGSRRAGVSGGLERAGGSEGPGRPGGGRRSHAGRATGVQPSSVRRRAVAANVLTHCNAGWLAAQDWGTALAPVYKAAERGEKVFVYADETRPRLQGARITSWELQQQGVEHAVIADNAAASVIRSGRVDVVITGADRIAANGDVANKIGTYPLALAARANGVPFYVAVPLSTIDPSTPAGNAIPIEERDSSEVRYVEGLDDSGTLRRVRVTPDGVPAFNPAFDVTSADLVTGIITEHGVFPATAAGIAAALAGNSSDGSRSVAG